MATKRPVVCVVTAHWGTSEDESTEVVRLLAGAIARNATVHVVHLDSTAFARGRYMDSVFSVHRLPLTNAAPKVAAVIKAALAAAGDDSPGSLTTAIRAFEGEVDGLMTTVAEVEAESVVLAGLPLPITAKDLADIGGTRLIVWPMLADLNSATEPRNLDLFALADAIGTLHPGEQQLLTELMSNAADKVVPLDISLTLNRSATEQGLFGVGWFGRYVLLIRQFPQNGPRFDQSVTHELLRSVLGDIAIAEVAGGRWRVSDFTNTAQLPVNPTRVNLWRLMAHAEFTVDLRPGTPFGREAIESMLFSSPPIVPENSSAHAHVLQANGGLWYNSPGELLDLANCLIDDEHLRSNFRDNGFAYAKGHHEQMEDFVERTRRLILG